MQRGDTSLPRKQRKLIVVMLGARMRKTRRQDWSFPLISQDKTNSGSTLPVEVSGGASRMRAVQALYQGMQARGASAELLVLVTGGQERSGKSRADEAARQLVVRYGLPREAVVSIGGIGSTLGNAAATAQYIATNRKRIGNVGKICVLTNNYHMLRAWIIFSKGLLATAAGEHAFIPSGRDTVSIKQMLNNGLPRKGRTWADGQICIVREKVMNTLQPYFSKTGVEIIPLVVEDLLDQNTATVSQRRYASLLRNNQWVRETLRFEYRGIKDMLWPKKHPRGAQKPRVEATSIRY